MEAILKGCDPKIVESVRANLKERTRKWVDSREQENIPKDIVDKYARMLLEVIESGSTSHSKEFTSAKSIDYKQHTREDVQSFMDASHKSHQVDKMFESNPNRKATAPDVRSRPVGHAGHDDAHFIHISGQKDTILALTNDGTLLKFSQNQWKPLSRIAIMNVSQIYQLREDHNVLALDVAGQVFFSDRSLTEWKPIQTTGKAVLKIAIGMTTTIAVDEKNSLLQLTRDGWAPFTAISVDKDTTELTFGKHDKLWKIDKNGRIWFSIDWKKWEMDPVQPPLIRFRYIYASLWNDEIWAIDEKEDVYFRESDVTKRQEWIKEKGPRAQVLAFIDDAVVALDKNHDVWHRDIPVDNPRKGQWARMGSASEILGKQETEPMDDWDNR